MRRGYAGVAVPFLIFFATALVVAWPSLNYRWYGDDLHLVREFSNDELALAWHHEWDLDGIESVGYRPLTVMFNAARAWAFGDSTEEHRLFLITLFAIYLVLMARIGQRFGLTPAATTLAGVMAICAKYSSYHFVWIADGVHIAQGIPFALALLAILRWVDTGAARWRWGSLACFATSMLVREDSMAVAVVLAGLAMAYSHRVARWPEQRSRLVAYAAWLMAISIAGFLGRQVLLTPATNPSWTPFKYLAIHPFEVITLAGWQPLVLLPIFIAILALLLTAVARWTGQPAHTAWAWLACAAASSLPGIVETRVDLLFFPITFYCLFAAQVLTAYASAREQWHGGWGRGLAIALIVVCVWVPARASRQQQLSMAPGSAGNIEISCDIARNGEWARVTSKPRRDEALGELARLGIDTARCESLIDASGQVDATVPLPAGVFIPSMRFLSR